MKFITRISITGLIPVIATVMLQSIASGSDFKMPELPAGANPQNMKEVREALEPQGWVVERPNLQIPDNITVHQNILYKKTKEKDLHLDLYMTSEKEGNPLVIVIHGGGWKQGSKEAYANHSIWLASNGYNVAAIQYRLSGEAKFPAARDDCLAAVDWLVEKAGEYGYDKNRIAVYGGSAGAHLAALTGTLHNKVGAMLVIAGPTNLVTDRVKDESKDPDSNYFKFFGAPIHEIPEIYKEASPLFHVSKDTPPVLLVAEYSLEGSSPFLEILEQFDIPVETMILSGGVHGHWNWNPWFTPTLEKCLEFLDSVFK